MPGRCQRRGTYHRAAAVFYIINSIVQVSLAVVSHSLNRVTVVVVIVTVVVIIVTVVVVIVTVVVVILTVVVIIVTVVVVIVTVVVVILTVVVVILTVVVVILTVVVVIVITGKQREMEREELYNLPEVLRVNLPCVFQIRSYHLPAPRDQITPHCHHVGTLTAQLLGYRD